MKSLMKLGILILFSPLSLDAQDATSFELSKTPSDVEASRYEKALRKADLDRYRYRQGRRTISFKEGVEVELLSAQEMNDKGLPVDLSKVMEQKAKGKDKVVFELTESGHILELHQGRKKEKGK